MSDKLKSLLQQHGGNRQAVIDFLVGARLHHEGAFDLLCELAMFGLFQISDSEWKGLNQHEH